MVPGNGPSHDVTPMPTDSTAAALAAVRSGDADYACVPIENSIEGSVLPTLDSLATGPQLQIFAELTLDVAFTHRGATRHHRRRRADGRRVPGGRARRCGTGWPRNLPKAQVVPANSNAAAANDVADGRADAGVSTALAAERYGLAALAAGVVDEPNARTRFVLVGPPGPPPAQHRRGPHVGGAAARQRARRAGVGADRVRDPRHRPDPHRIPAHPKGVGHLHVLPGLRRPHRRRRGRRGTQGAAPSLCRCAISGFMADGIGRRRGAAATRRGVAVAGCGCGRRRTRRDERAAGTGPARPVARQRRAAARHPAARARSSPTWAANRRAHSPATGRTRSAMVAHSVAVRAAQTAAEIGDELGLAPTSSRASTRSRSAIWRTATTTRPSRSSTPIYQRWHEGDLDAAAARRRDRPARCSTATCR